MDREWEIEKDDYKLRGQQGYRDIPSKAGSAFGGLFIVGFGVFWTIGATSAGAPVFFTLFGVGFTLFGLIRSVQGFGKAGEHEIAESAYERRRAEMARKLDEVRGGE